MGIDRDRGIFLGFLGFDCCQRGSGAVHFAWPKRDKAPLLVQRIRMIEGRVAAQVYSALCFFQHCLAALGAQDVVAIRCRFHLPTLAVGLFPGALLAVLVQHPVGGQVADDKSATIGFHPPSLFLPLARGRQHQDIARFGAENFAAVAQRQPAGIVEKRVIRL